LTIATIDRSDTSIASGASPPAWQTVDCDRLLASRDAAQALVCADPPASDYSTETDSYHIVMLDEPQWLAETLTTAA